MRIALYCPTVSGNGGMETAIRNLMEGFRALGDECRLYIWGGSFDEEWLRDLPHTMVGSPRESRIARLAKYAVAPAWEMLRWRPDAVIAADVTTLLMARSARRAIGRPGIPVAAWLHFPLDQIRMKEKLPLADGYLAINSDMAADIRSAIPGKRDAVFTIYNGVPTAGQALTPRPAPSEPPLFVYVGRLTYDDHKRVNDLLEALALVRGPFRAKIVGAEQRNSAADHTGRLRALATRLGLDDRVAWLGWQARPWEAARPASALVMTSAFEGFGMVLVEAVSRGIPCVSSDCKSGPSEIILPGENGWLYPVGDVAALAERLQLIVDDPAAALPPADAVQRTAARFSETAVAERAHAALLAVGARDQGHGQGSGNSAAA